jgi:outer membrane protein OmpA-like peptidoglycan-associated protein
MAVSQFLRPGSLMDAVKGYLTPDTVRSASSLVGESESSTLKTLNDAVPSVFSGLTNMVSSREGVASFGELVRDSRYGSAVDNVGSLFGGGSTTKSMVGAGQQLIDKIFSGKASPVAGLLVRSGGVSSSSANTLLSLAASLTMGVLGKRAAAQGLDANALANTLLSEKSGITAAVPSGLSQILGGGPAVVSRTPEVAAQTPRSVTDVRKGPVIHSYPEHSYPEPHGQRRWIALVLIAFGVLVLLSFIRPRTLRGVESDLEHFLGDSSRSAPRMFELDDLHFHAGTAQLTAGSEQAVDHLAGVLKANPNAQIQLVGHINNTGSTEANRTLTLDRVNAVKAMLGDQGVPVERISTIGVSQHRTAVSNDTDLRGESHGADGDLASTLAATLYRANAQRVSQDQSVASNDDTDLRSESHGADGELASSLSGTLDRDQNPRIELIVVSK